MALYEEPLPVPPSSSSGRLDSANSGGRLYDKFGSFVAGATNVAPTARSNDVAHTGRWNDPAYADIYAEATYTMPGRVDSDTRNDTVKKLCSGNYMTAEVADPSNAMTSQSAEIGDAGGDGGTDSARKRQSITLFANSDYAYAASGPVPASRSRDRSHDRTDTLNNPTSADGDSTYVVHNPFAPTHPANVPYENMAPPPADRVRGRARDLGAVEVIHPERETMPLPPVPSVFVRTSTLNQATVAEERRSTELWHPTRATPAALSVRSKGRTSPSPDRHASAAVVASATGYGTMLWGCG